MTQEDNPQVQVTFNSGKENQEEQFIKRGWKKLAEHYQKSQTTVREWVAEYPDNPCPHWMEGTTHVFDVAEVDEWLEQRSEKKDAEKMSLEKLRKLSLEADRLQREKDIAEGRLAPVEDYIEAYSKVFRKLVILNEKFIKDVKRVIPNLSADKSDKLDAALVEFFNEASELEH